MNIENWALIIDYLKMLNLPFGVHD